MRMTVYAFNEALEKMLYDKRREPLYVFEIGEADFKVANHVLRNMMHMLLEKVRRKYASDGYEYYKHAFDAGRFTVFAFYTIEGEKVLRSCISSYSWVHSVSSLNFDPGSLNKPSYSVVSNDFSFSAETISNQPKKTVTFQEALKTAQRRKEQKPCQKD